MSFQIKDYLSICLLTLLPDDRNRPSFQNVFCLEYRLMDKSGKKVILRYENPSEYF